MVGMGYQQINVDHIVFFKREGGHIMMLAVYVDDMIITGDDEDEIARLKVRLRKEFEMKDLGHLKYFLGIEVTRGSKEIILSQRKYVLDLLKEMSMLDYKPATTLIDQKSKLSAEAGEPIDDEMFQRLMGRLIYLSHIRPDISFTVSVASRYMHDPRKDHMNAMYQILRFLKSAPRKGLIYRKNGHLTSRVIAIQTGLVVLTTGSPRMDTTCL
jgi:Reverse transcriptase (RNA-dependent DNA polymerase)